MQNELLQMINTELNLLNMAYEGGILNRELLACKTKMIATLAECMALKNKKV
jgi:hypothetical protein